MIIKDEAYEKSLRMFENLKKYIGKPVKVIYYNQDRIEYYISILEKVDDFKSIMLKNNIYLEFFADTKMIYEICFGGEVLYRNPNKDRFYYDKRENAFGITPGLMEFYKDNKRFAYQNKEQEKYAVQLEGINLVKEDKQKEWLAFIENYYNRFNDSVLITTVLNLLKKIHNRTSYEVIYNNLINDKEDLYEGELLIALDIISYFTEGGKFLKEYILNRLQNKGLTLTLKNQF